MQRAREPPARRRARLGRRAGVAEAEARALEFILAHGLYRSHRTGEVASERFIDLTYPWHWHTRLTPAIHDDRAADGLDVLRSNRKANGRWPLQTRIAGTLLVEMEKPGGESRWTRCAH